jgi:REP element-mobilizing transposase RayT
MQINRISSLVCAVWEDLPRRFPGVELDEWRIMPNHFHGILVLPGDGATPGAIEIVRAFKAVCSTQIRKTLMPSFAWQRGMHDRIIRNERELHAIREYIVNNVLKWDLDRENPSA